jgi:hypothetical protein
VTLNRHNCVQSYSLTVLGEINDTSEMRVCYGSGESLRMRNAMSLLFRSELRAQETPPV